MSEIPTAAPLASIRQDVLCIRCGYNVRGLDPGGVCPECGSPISLSLRGDLLRFADPAWIRRLHFGTTLKLWNILIVIVIGLIAGISVTAGAPYAFIVFVGGVGALLGLWATFAITTQEPRTSLVEDPVTLRKVIRTGAVVSAAGGIAQQFANVGRVPGTAPVVAFSGIWIAVSIVSGVAGFLVLIGELKYFRRFALRAPDHQLARSTRILMWGLGVTTGFSTLVAILMPVVLAPMMAGAVPAAAAGPTAAPSGPPTAPLPPALGTPGGILPIAAVSVGFCLVGAAAAIFGLWYVLLLFRYRRLFRNALATAAPPQAFA